MFEREDRYIVVKIKNLDEDQQANLWCCIWDNNIKTSNCVVVESDWPEYEQVWTMVEQRMIEEK